MVTKNKTQKKDLKISPELHKALESLGGKGDTFERIIWRILSIANLNKEQKKVIEKAKEEWENKV